MFIDKEKKNYPFRWLCLVMEVSESGYYAWRKRLGQLPCLRRKSLKQLVRQCYFENRRRYGSRRLAKSLAKNGIRIGRRKVSGLMKEEGLKAIMAKVFKPKTTDSKGTTAAENLLTNIEPKECAGGRIIIGAHYLHPAAGRKVLLFSSLAGQNNQEDNRLEFIFGNDCGVDYFRLKKSHSKRLG